MRTRGDEMAVNAGSRRVFVHKAVDIFCPETVTSMYILQNFGTAEALLWVKYLAFREH